MGEHSQAVQNPDDFCTATSLLENTEVKVFDNRGENAFQSVEENFDPIPRNLFVRVARLTSTALERISGGLHSDVPVSFTLGNSHQDGSLYVEVVIKHENKTSPLLDGVASERDQVWFVGADYFDGHIRSKYQFHAFENAEPISQSQALIHELQS